MKAILIETGLVVGATIFWAVALPGTTMFFVAASLWHSIQAQERPERGAPVVLHRAATATV